MAVRRGTRRSEDHRKGTGAGAASAWSIILFNLEDKSW